MARSSPYPVPLEPVIFEETIKKSRFITYLAHTEGVEQARAFVERLRLEHPQARHHCWAFVAGRPDDGQRYGFSDDGEPSGTAGKPILAQLCGSGVGEITAVVVRYYGGVRLGTGGLVKAYGGGVGQALAQLKSREKVITAILAMACDYAELAVIERVCARCDARVASTDYGQRIDLRLEVAAGEAEKLCLWIHEATRGQVEPRIMD